MKQVKAKVLQALRKDLLKEAVALRKSEAFDGVDQAYMRGQANAYEKAAELLKDICTLQT